MPRHWHVRPHTSCHTFPAMGVYNHEQFLRVEMNPPLQLRVCYGCDPTAASMNMAALKVVGNDSGDDRQRRQDSRRRSATGAGSL